MQKFETLTGVAAPLNIVNIDTDMIIPKQFLKTIERTGLGKSLFFEMRYSQDGKELPDFVLNRPAYRKAQILVAGDNFGCGSSREHAPWAIDQYGFRAILAPSFADIFFNNCFKNGLLPIVLPEAAVSTLFNDCAAFPGYQLTIDLERQVGLGNVKMYARHEMIEVVKIDGKARGIIARDLVSGKLERHFGHAVLLCTGGYGNVFYLSTNAMGSNVTAAWKAHKSGAYFGNPCFTQIHPTCIPVSGHYQSKLTLMSESLRNDGRIWVPKKQNDNRHPNDIPEDERDYYLERRYPAFGNLVPRDIASRAAKERCDAGYGVGQSKMAVYLDFKYNMMQRYGRTEASKLNISNPDDETLIRLGKEVVKEKYGNLFDMYKQITDEDPYEVPMRIYPAVHYTMGGLWVDYDLMTTVPGLYALGEANFSDHGANRLGASALMQGLADGYFVIPITIGNYLSKEIHTKPIPTDHEAFVAAEKAANDRIHQLMNIQGTRSVESYHRELGLIMWNKCGMARNEKGLKEAIAEIQALRADFYKNVRIPGSVNEFNPELDKAGRVADFLELGELMCVDALNRNESCGGHFREEFQTEEGEALRDDENYMYVAAWESKGDTWELHKEELKYENIKIQQRSYK